MSEPVGFLYCEGVQYWFGCQKCRPTYEIWVSEHPNNSKYSIYSVYAGQLYPFGQTCGFCCHRKLSEGKDDLVPGGIFVSNSPQSVASGESCLVTPLDEVEAEEELTCDCGECSNCEICRRNCSECQNESEDTDNGS